MKFTNHSIWTVIYASDSCIQKRLIVVLYYSYVGDIARIPEMLANALTEAAGVDADVADDDDEMTSPVKKGKHRKINPGY